MASSIPKEPRQMMINLMYLVLTAMLALNITREVLNAFNVINSSIESSNATIFGKNEQYYKQFEAKMANADEREFAKPYNDKALAIKAESDKMVAYLNTWKDSIIAVSGGTKINAAGETELNGMEDINASNRLFIDQNNGDVIKKRLLDYKQFILSQVDDEATRKQLLATLPLQIKDPASSEDNPSGSWSYGTFHNIPVVASIAMFSKFQNDVRNSESQMVEYLFSKIGETRLVIDDFFPVAVPNTSYALAGDDITATITLAAYNKAATPTITSNRGAVSVTDGIGTLKFKASGAGLQTVNGVITTANRGKTKSYPYKFEYMVGSAGASLQLDKMNVMFIGLDNPITISAAGYNIEDVSVAFDGADVKTIGKGTYNVRVSKTTNALPYRILAKSKSGASTTVGSGTMRVREVPDPVAEVGGKSSGLMATANAKAQAGVVAQLKDFYYDTRFQVVSFNFAFIPKNGQALDVANVGPAWNGTVKELIGRSRAGDRWVISDVRAKGPDGRTRVINPVIITLN